MRILRVGLCLFFAVNVSQCALTHPTNVSIVRADADVPDVGPTDTPIDGAEVSDVSDVPDVPDVADVTVDAGPCGAATQRCCSAVSGGRDAGLDASPDASPDASLDASPDAGGLRSCNAGLACTGGICNPCSMGMAECGGVCVPINTAQNCGTCGTACVQGQGCVVGDGGVLRCEIICPMRQTLCGTGCVSVVDDPMNCGACGRRCEFANATATCSSGICTLGACLSGFENCNMTASDGCETNIRTSATNCGTCGTVCRFDHGAATCERGVCTLGACERGFGDCDGNAANGCEINTASSPLHCNRCGLVCPTMGGAPACRAGVCGTSTCAAGRGDCDNMAGNGCETDLTTTATNCGICGNGCSFPNASATCVPSTGAPPAPPGRCALGTCATGFADCDGNGTNGCEVNLRTDVTHCGMCPTSCRYANGTATCVAGLCTLTSCAPGFANCDTTPSNGCEVDTRSNVSNCGACTNVCIFANGVAACTGSACSLASCVAGFGNCDNNSINGCEVNTQTTVAHCGACNRPCVLANAFAGCALGACVVASCNSGFGNCNGNPADGCETNVNTAVAHCGTCGNNCSLANATPTCMAGACRVLTCNAGFADCDMAPGNGCETDIRTTTNCGTCGRACTTGEVCTSGICDLVCPGAQRPCSGSCVFIDRDAAHCGGCGRACSSANGTPSCASSTCSIACNSGFGNCNAMVSDGCEAPLNTNTNCGACAAACARANAAASCSSGSCVLGACNSGFANCNMNAADGCETALRTVSNCSRCGDVCGSFQATPNCVAGPPSACNLTCNAGYYDCNSDAADGCELSLRTLTNCASCGTACTRANATPTCSTGACAIQTCNTNFGNCNSTDSDGCETNLLTTATRCGSCGTACLTPTGTSANVCVSGTCSPTCATGFASCDGNPTNGCEVNTQINSSNCGACGTVCQVNSNTPTSVCTVGVCVPTCATGFADCDGNPNNGCETNLSSASNCGACGTVCAFNQSCTASGPSFACTVVCGNAGQVCCGSMACSGGAACLSNLCCVSPAVNCSGTCATLSSDSSNCGTCGTVCAITGTSSTTCAAGVCVPTCSTNFGNCDGNPNNGCEADLRSTSSHCGTCGTACTAPTGTSSTSCVSRVCVPVCATNYGNCDGNPNNGCEANLATSNSNCSACGVACLAPMGTTSNTCTETVCVPVCAAGYGDCDGNRVNGCETNLNTTTANCGACGTVCSTAGTSSTSCVSGVCAPVCSAGNGDCDSNRVNGCETNLNTTTANCGACGTVCSTAGTSSTSCVSGVCAPMCSAGNGDCDTSRVNGCETSLNTNTNCGACGTACMASTTTCIVATTTSCVACGAAGQPCCATGTACAGSCNLTTNLCE